MIKVVWLTSWYPNAADPFTGDFIQRHARATAAFQPIDVLFIGREHDHAVVDPNDGYGFVAGLTERRLYYTVKTDNGRSGGLRAAGMYWKTFRNWLREYREKNGLPDLIHVHVAMRAGLLALFLKKKHGIPYILTEHWTGYFDDSAHPVRSKGPFYRFLLKTILRNASMIMPVSADLGNRMQSLFGDLPLHVIPNTVDTRHFFPRKTTRPLFRFLHVSAMTQIKNPEGILRTFCRLIDSGADAELVMVGPYPETIAKDLPHTEKIRFTGPVSYETVAAEMQNADAFVLFSQRENQPCVLLEALCCGIPVIATRTGGIPELIDDSNGLLVTPADEPGLLTAMKTMMDDYADYDPATISARASALFSYAVIGNAYAECYKAFAGSPAAES